jgi:hypothetical protein
MQIIGSDTLHGPTDETHAKGGTGMANKVPLTDGPFLSGLVTTPTYVSWSSTLAASPELQGNGFIGRRTPQTARVRVGARLTTSRSLLGIEAIGLVLFPMKPFPCSSGLAAS